MIVSISNAINIYNFGIFAPPSPMQVETFPLGRGQFHVSPPPQKKNIRHTHTATYIDLPPRLSWLLYHSLSLILDTLFYHPDWV